MLLSGSAASLLRSVNCWRGCNLPQPECRSEMRFCHNFMQHFLLFKMITSFTRFDKQLEFQKNLFAQQLKNKSRSASVFHVRQPVAFMESLVVFSRRPLGTLWMLPVWYLVVFSRSLHIQWCKKIVHGWKIVANYKTTRRVQKGWSIGITVTIRTFRKHVKAYQTG